MKPLENARIRVSTDADNQRRQRWGGQWAILGNVKVLSHFALFFHGTPFSLSLPLPLCWPTGIFIFLYQPKAKRERERAQELRQHVVCDALRMYARDVDWHCPIPYPLSQREWEDRCRGGREVGVCRVVVCQPHIDGDGDAGKPTKKTTNMKPKRASPPLSFSPLPSCSAVLINYCLDYDFNVF